MGLDLSAGALFSNSEISELKLLKVIPIACHDVLEKERAKEALREAEIRLSLAIEASKLSVWDWNLETNELVWTDNTRALCGLHAKAPVSYETFLRALHPDDRERVNLAIAKALDPRGDGRYQEEYRAIGIEDGVERWAVVWGQAFFDEKGKPYRFLGMGMDITERKRSEAALIQLTEELKAKSEKLALATERLEETNKKLKHTVDELVRSNEDLDRFASVVSHDLKQPIQTVSLVSDLLIRRFADKLDEKGKSLLDQIRKGSARMGQLVDSLTKYARVQHGEKPFASVDMGEVLRLTMESLFMNIQETGATFELGKLPTVTGDAVRLGELFQNLVCNSLKYRTAGIAPKISITCQEHPLEWEFLVVDNGIGIDPAHHEAIFGMFNRLHSQAAYDGTGVGLTICKKIVELHKGRIWVESRLGEGCRFHFTLSKNLEASPKLA